jgi:D-glycero-D-manno-heptose 1,7-bisphosphate phosphatase
MGRGAPLERLKVTSVYPPGIFAEQFGSSIFAQSPCLFLDRDGVVVEETNYLHSVTDVVFIPGVVEAVARANASSVPVVLVTNQAGIGRGLYGWDAFHAVQRHIYQHYREFDAHFDLVLACAYHAEGIGCYAIANHPWRKPRPGMLKEAERLLDVDLTRSFIVGDTLADLFAGEAAGLRAGALVETGHGLREWCESGEEAFANWAGAGRFSPSRYGSGGDAILSWLDGLHPSRQT